MHSKCARVVSATILAPEVALIRNTPLSIATIAVAAVTGFGLGLGPDPFPGARPAFAQANSDAAERIRPGDIVVANLGDHSVSVFDGETGA